MRYCRYCSKLLPAKTSRQRFFCPEEPGKPRCRDLARKLILKGKGNPDLLLKNFHRFAPRGAAGFRLRLVQGNYTWTGPRLGIRNHKNATGAMRQGDFYFLDEKPRVPRTEDYFIDYVDASGALVLPLERAPLVRLQATGGTFRDTPSETMRNKIKCLDSGRPLPPARKRVFELARASDAPTHALLAALHRLDPRLTAEAVCELSVLADELRHHQELMESTHYGCRRRCRLCGACSEGTALEAQPALKLPLRHGPLCVGQLARALLQKHPVLAEVATAERRSRRTDTAQALAEGTRLASLQRFYGCRAGTELAAQLAHNAALPPSPYSHGVAAVLLWALGLGPCPVEPAAPFSEAHAQRLAAPLRSGAQSAAARERALGIGQATAWLLDEHAPAPSNAGPGLAPETSPPPQPLPGAHRRAPHG